MTGVVAGWTDGFTHLCGMSIAQDDTMRLGLLEPLWSVGDLAAYLGVPVATIYDWRSNGKGPVAHRFGKHVKFAVSDIQTWLAAQRETRPGADRHSGADQAVQGGGWR